MSAGTLHVTVMSAESALTYAGSPIVLRSRVLAERYRAVLDVASSDLDDILYDGGSFAPNWRDAVIDRLASTAVDYRVAYVVSGHPLLGDETVGHLLSLAHDDRVTVEIIDQGLQKPLSDEVARHAGSVACVDALAILEAESNDPFAGGSLPVSSNLAVIICNVVPSRDGPALYNVLSRRYQAGTGVTVIPADGSSEPRSMTLDDFRGAVEPTVCWLTIPPAVDDQFYRSTDDLQRLVARLRAPDGCPWDREQTNRSLTRNLIEESYELLDAIESGDTDEMREELGDFVLQAFLHAQIAEEDGNFTLEDVLATLIDKLVRRHPHVFASTLADDSETVVRNWDDIKREERAAKRDDGTEDRNPLGNVPASLPALLRAQNLLKRAGRTSMSTEEVRQHRRIAAERVDDDAERAAALDAMLETLEQSGAAGIDLEELLRDWTRSFEESIVRGAEIDSPR